MVWWMIHPTPTHALCFMCHVYSLCLSNKHCSMSSPPIIVGVFRLWWTDCPWYKCSLWAGSGRQVQLVLLLRYHRFLLGCLSLLSCVLCNLYWSAHLSFVHLCLCMLVRTTVRGIHRLEQLPFFTFKDLLLADDERYAAGIDCEHLSAGEAFAKLCFLMCQCYIRGCWIWTHCIMDLSVSQEKWIRHWSKACPAC